MTEQNMSDPEFQTFRVKIRRYKSFVVNHPDRVTPPAWAKGKIEPVADCQAYFYGNFRVLLSQVRWK